MGRQIFSAEFNSLDTSSTIVDTLCPIISAALKDKDAKVRAAAVTSFGHVSEIEWCTLLRRFKLEWHPYMDEILRLCSKAKGESNSKVRSSACKAIGDICTCVMGSSCCTRELVLTLSQKMCHEMETALKDECSSVRSMGIFALGNMALSLKEHHNEVDTMLPLLPQLHHIFIITITLLHDKDEKVGNTKSMLSSGHLLLMLLTTGISGYHKCYKGP